MCDLIFSRSLRAKHTCALLNCIQCRAYTFALVFRLVIIFENGIRKFVPTTRVTVFTFVSRQSLTFGSGFRSLPELRAMRRGELRGECRVNRLHIHLPHASTHDSARRSCEWVKLGQHLFIKRIKKINYFIWHVN